MIIIDENKEIEQNKIFGNSKILNKAYEQKLIEILNGIPGNKV